MLDRFDAEDSARTGVACQPASIFIASCPPPMRSRERGLFELRLDTTRSPSSPARRRESAARSRSALPRPAPTSCSPSIRRAAMRRSSRCRPRSKALGRKAIVVPTDVSHVDQVRAMIDQAKDTFGRVDILVNNAGWTGTTPALDVTEDEYDRTMAASLKSVFFACQAAAQRDDPAGRREDHQHRIELRRRRVPGSIGVRRGQGRRPPPLARAVARVGQTRRDGERRRARASPRRTRGRSSSNVPATRSGRRTRCCRSDAGISPRISSAPCCFSRASLSDMVVGHVLMVDGGWTIH